LRFFALSDNYIHYPHNKGIATFLDEYLEKKNKEIEILPEKQRIELLDKYYKEFEQH
jgi:hypothetical protein